MYSNIMWKTEKKLNSCEFFFSFQLYSYFDESRHYARKTENHRGSDGMDSSLSVKQVTGNCIMIDPILVN